MQPGIGLRIPSIRLGLAVGKSTQEPGRAGTREQSRDGISSYRILRHQWKRDLHCCTKRKTKKLNYIVSAIARFVLTCFRTFALRYHRDVLRSRENLEDNTIWEKRGVIQGCVGRPPRILHDHGIPAAVWETREREREGD